MIPVLTDSHAILDIGSTLAEQSALEKEAYLHGVYLIPSCFLDVQNQGFQRNINTLWMERETHDHLQRILQERLLQTHHLIWLQERYRQRSRALASSISTVEGQQHAQELWEKLVAVMPFVALNWLVDREVLAEHLIQCTGWLQHEAEAWLGEVTLPDTLPHFFQYQLELLHLALQVMNGDIPQIQRFSEAFGCLQTGLLARCPHEDPALVMQEVHRLCEQHPSRKALLEHIQALNETHQDALKRRSRRIGEAALAAVATSCTEQVLHLARLLVFVSNEEEERHILQRRALARLRDYGLGLGLTLNDLSVSRLGLQGSVPAQLQERVVAGAHDQV